MTDFHTHILPDIDDGSRSVYESVEMLEKLHTQGIDRVVLTPHFYAYRNDLDSFFDFRRHSLSILTKKLQKTPVDIDIYIGSEILYFDELWRIDNLEKLCILGTDYIMIEMPFSSWSDSVIQGIERIANRRLTPVIAHLDRYLQYAGVKSRIDELLGFGTVFQVNCDCFTKFTQRHKGLNLWKKGFVSLLGSDCHNMDKRPPNFDVALDFLKKHVSERSINQLEQRSNRILDTAQKVY